METHLKIKAREHQRYVCTSMLETQISTSAISRCDTSEYWRAPETRNPDLSCRSQVFKSGSCSHFCDRDWFHRTALQSAGVPQDDEPQADIAC